MAQVSAECMYGSLTRTVDFSLKLGEKTVDGGLSADKRSNPKLEQA